MRVASESEARLLEAAGQLFAEKGFQAATVREILARAGVKNIAAVNYYFRDKEGLYRAALRHAFEGRMEIGLPEWPAGTPPAERLRGLIRMILSRMASACQTFPWQVQLLVRELAHPSETAAELVRDFIRPVYELLWDILRDVLPADTPDEHLHLVAFSIVGQCFYLRVSRPVLNFVVGEQEVAGYDLERLADHIARFSLAALGLAPPLGKTDAAPSPRTTFRGFSQPESEA